MGHPCTLRHLLGYVKNPLAIGGKKEKGNLLVVPFHIVPLVHQRSPYWKFIPLNFQVASPRLFSICLRITFQASSVMSHPCPEVAGGPGHKLISISGKKRIVLPRHLSAQVAPGMEQMAEDPGKGSPGKSEDGLSSVQFSHSVMSDSL